MDVSLLLAGIVVGAALVVVIWFVVDRQRSARLQQRFGPEYQRAVSRAGDRRAAESELRDRQQRVEQLEIRPLAPDERERFAAQWREVQSRFVDEPDDAVSEADRLVGEVMSARGYPMADFEQRAADVSVDHPQVVDHYRTAHRIAGRRRDAATDTEELRQAMVHFRALFSELLEEGAPPHEPTHPQKAAGRSDAEEREREADEEVAMRSKS